MMTQKTDIYQLKNGMVLLGERLENVLSVSFQFLLPAGASLLPEGCCGAGTIIADWLFRGAGQRSSRELIQALDRLGIHRNASPSAHHLSLTASLESSNLSEALDLCADIILRPQLAADQFELSRQLSVSELQGLDDDPRQKAMILLYEHFYPDPLGRPAIGKLDELNGLSFERTAEIARNIFNPTEVIFSICGNYDFEAVKHQLEKTFDRPSHGGLSAQLPVMKEKSYRHFPTEGAQVHIGIMTPAPLAASDAYYEMAAAVSILSGSMSSRLFTEVREKRGLCYAVGANYKTLKDHAGIACYAGTTPDKAQQTLDVILDQFRILKNGISDDEMQRAKVGLKTSLIMQSESTHARSSGIAADHFLLGRIRTLDEIREKIEAVSVDSVQEFLSNHPFKDFTVVTLGPKTVTL
ncbi:MAG: insulinase family protein [Phycisphaerae bacterium]|nr:insulinase family protein [Phycisphaerae bacterium]